MSIYSFLKEKADLCRTASGRAENPAFKKMWMDKANELETIIGNMPVVIGEIDE